jgi:hypothetical protein
VGHEESGGSDLIQRFCRGTTKSGHFHLQHADAILCIGEVSIGNFSTVKAIFRGFELISELKVNFWKSCLIGINVTLGIWLVCF